MKTIMLMYELDDEFIRKSYLNVNTDTIEGKMQALQTILELAELYSHMPFNQQKAFYIQNNLKDLVDDSEYKIMLADDLVYTDYDNYTNPTKPHSLEEALNVFNKFLNNNSNVDPEESLIVYVNKNLTNNKEGE